MKKMLNIKLFVVLCVFFLAVTAYASEPIPTLDGDTIVESEIPQPENTVTVYDTKGKAMVITVVSQDGDSETDAGKLPAAIIVNAGPTVKEVDDVATATRKVAEGHFLEMLNKLREEVSGKVESSVAAAQKSVNDTITTAKAELAGAIASIKTAVKNNGKAIGEVKTAVENNGKAIVEVKTAVENNGKAIESNGKSIGGLGFGILIGGIVGLLLIIFIIMFSAWKIIRELRKGDIAQKVDRVDQNVQQMMVQSFILSFSVDETEYEYTVPIINGNRYLGLYVPKPKDDDEEPKTLEEIPRAHHRTKGDLCRSCRQAMKKYNGEDCSPLQKQLIDELIERGDVKIIDAEE